MGQNPDELLDLEAYRVAKAPPIFEMILFWQRSNYFLVLSTAVAAGFFSLRDLKYAIPLAIFGLDQRVVDRREPRKQILAGSLGIQTPSLGRTTSAGDEPLLGVVGDGAGRRQAELHVS